MLKVNVIENKNDKLKIEINDLTLVNLLNENMWKQKSTKWAAYSKDHPYLSEPMLTIKSSNPKKTLLDAAEQIIEDVEDLQKQLKRA